jgi:conjugal transfer pilin signal peptidase TrbI
VSRAGILKTAAFLILAGVFFGSFILPGLGKRILVDTQPQGCLPWHVYWGQQRPSSEPLVPGDLVVFDTPKMRAIDPKDAYSKLKMVAAVAGQTVSVKEGAIWIDGRYWGRFWIAPWIDSRHIDVSAPWFQNGKAVNGSWTVPVGDVLLLGTEPYSFDARYWGFLRADALGAKAQVL